MRRFLVGLFVASFLVTPSTSSAQADVDGTNVLHSTDTGCNFYFILAFEGQGFEGQVGGFLDKAGKHKWHWTQQDGVACKPGELISGTGTLTDNRVKFIQGRFVKGFLDGSIRFFVESNGTPSPKAEPIAFHSGCPAFEAPPEQQLKCVPGRGDTEESANARKAEDKSPAAIEQRMWSNCATQIKYASDLRASSSPPISADSVASYYKNLVASWAAAPDSGQSLRRRAESLRIGAAAGANPISVRLSACMIGERFGAEAAKTIIDAMQRTSESLVIEQRMRSVCAREINAAAQFMQSLTPPQTLNVDQRLRSNSSLPDSNLRRNRNSLRALGDSVTLNAVSLLTLCMINSRLGSDIAEQSGSTQMPASDNNRPAAISAGDSRQVTDMMSSCSGLIEPAVIQQVGPGGDRKSELSMIRRLAATFASMTPIEIVRELNRWAENTYHDPVSDLRRCLQNRRFAQVDGSVPGLAGTGQSSANSARTATVEIPKPATRTSAAALDLNRACERFYRQLLSNDNYSGQDVDVYARLSRDTKLLYEGPCASAPDAQKNLAFAEEMKGSGNADRASLVINVSVPGLPTLRELEAGVNTPRSTTNNSTRSNSAGDSRQVADMMSSCSELIEPAIASQIATGATRASELQRIRGEAAYFTSMDRDRSRRESERWAMNTYHDPVSDLGRCFQSRRLAQVNGSVPGLADAGGSSASSAQRQTASPPPVRGQSSTPNSPSTTSNSTRNNSTTDTKDNSRFSVQAVPNCATYEQMPRHLQYDAYQMTNICAFGVIGKIHFFYSGQRYYNNDGGFALRAGEKVKHSFLNSSPRQPWNIMYTTCPDRAEMARRTGRKVAGVYFENNGGCYGMFEPDPVGIAR